MTEVRQRRRGPELGRAPAEDGSISVAGAVFGLGIVTLIGLVLMHGQSLGALSRTREAADNAARAGAQQVDIGHLLATGEVRLDPVLAADAATDYTRNLPAVSVTRVEVDGPSITVTVAETVIPVGEIGRAHV